METPRELSLSGGIQTPDLPQKPKIFGVLNVTSDSFSDGGKYLEPIDAIEKALSLVAEGADVIDIGAQSSNVQASMVPAELEWERIEGLIKNLKRENISVSIDSFKPYVIQKALEEGVDYINHIRGFTDSESLELLQNYTHLPTKFITMYSQDHGSKAGKHSDLTPETVVEKTLEFFRERKETFSALGLSEDKMIFDPGMGFFLSPDYKVSFAVLSSIRKILEEFPELMVSVTRKSFLGNALGGLPVEEREIPTIVAELHLWLSGVPMIRTHSPASFLKAIKTWELANTRF